MTEQRRITDELRERIEAVRRVSGLDFKRLTAIADRIDAAHEDAVQHEHMTAYDAGYDEGYASADDWLADNEDEMSKHGWVKLPVDADGEPIHVGDKLQDGWHEPNRGEVEWLILDRHGWWLRFKSGCERFYAHEFHEWRHHHKQPTVEDVLCELLDKVDDDRAGQAEIIAEYAAKLRLAGSDAE